MIECPFCLGEIVGEAVACRHCGRDLSGQINLLRKVDALERDLADLRAHVATGVCALEPAPASDLAAKSAEPKAAATAPIGEQLLLAALPVALIVGAHYLLILRWNLPPRSLLLATLLIPLPFGFLAMTRSRGALLFWVSVFLLVSFVAVVLMNANTAVAANSAAATAAGIQDQVSLLPQTPAEWWEDGQFALSIALSFLTGLIAGIGYLRRRYPTHPKLGNVRSDLAALHRGLLALVSEETVNRLSKYAASAGSLISAAGALFLGLRNI